MKKYLCAAGVLLLALSAHAQRPDYQLLRQNEDWSRVRYARGQDHFDSVKHVAFGEQSFITLGGQARLRFESARDFMFNYATQNSEPNDDSYLLYRKLMHADVQFGRTYRVFVEGKYANATTRELPPGFNNPPRSLDVDKGDLQQAFLDYNIDLFGNPATARFGRQGLNLGKQRLISTLDWSNTLRTYEGVVGFFSGYNTKVTAMATNFVPVKIASFNQNDSKKPVHGVYAQTDCWHHQLDGYWLYTEFDNRKFDDLALSRDKRHSFGVRVANKVDLKTGRNHSNMAIVDDTVAKVLDGFNYEGEFVYQIGDYGTRDVRAYSASGVFGLKFNAPGQPKLSFELDYASGGQSDSKLKTFNQLYPLGHKYLGFADIIGRQNIYTGAVAFKLKPSHASSVGAKVLSFARANSSDAVYNLGSGLVGGPSGANTNKAVGVEYNVYGNYQVDKHLKLHAAYNWFNAKAYLKNSALANSLFANPSIGYLQVQYTY